VLELFFHRIDHERTLPRAQSSEMVNRRGRVFNAIRHGLDFILD
jgi:hypothetical protein